MNLKYAGRSVFVWGHENMLPAMLKDVQTNAAAVHAVLPDLILEAGIFEIVTKAGVEGLRIPPAVFRAFDLPYVNRTFNYNAMLFPTGRFVDQWGKDSSVPDLTQAESQMWFFYAASSYIIQGVEALHCGQIMLMSSSDVNNGMVQTFSLFAKIRHFAAAHASLLHVSLFIFFLRAFPRAPSLC